MSTLHLMVRLPCSGKTSRARRLEQQCSALRLTPDEWQIRLFGNDVEELEHDERHTLIESLLWDVARRVLALGVDVILDFGFWASSEHEDYRARAAQLGAGSEIHYLSVPPAELMERAAYRNAHRGHAEFHVDLDKHRGWIDFFQPPTPDELERREAWPA